MQFTKRVDDKQSLLKQLKDDIKKGGKKNVYFLAGHFPLLYLKEFNVAIEGFSYWGSFSVFTLEVACILAKYAKEIGKNVKFVFFVDDHAYEDMSGLDSKSRSKRRNNLYSLRSGSDAVLPSEYKNIMNKYGFSEEDVLRHNHGKISREDCLYFSEKILRLSKKDIDNICAREYAEFIDDEKYFNKKDSYMIAFVPNRCKGHICEVALDEINDFNSSHVFLETMIKEEAAEKLFTEGLGVTYVRK